MNIFAHTHTHTHTHTHAHTHTHTHAHTHTRTHAHTNTHQCRLSTRNGGALIDGQSSDSVDLGKRVLLLSVVNVRQAVPEGKGARSLTSMNTHTQLTHIHCMNIL